MLDLQTLTFASVIATGFSSLFFTVVWRLNKNLEGINIWLAAAYCQTIGWLFLSMRDQINDVLSIVLSNFLILMSLLLFYLGVRAHLHKKVYLYPSLLLLAFAFIPLQILYTYVNPDVIPRILLVYGYSIIIMASMAFQLQTLSKEHKTTGTLMYQWVATIIIILCVFRLLTISPAIEGLYDPAFSNYINALVGFFLPQGLILGVFILAYEKREQRIDDLRNQAKLDAELKNKYLATLSHELRTPLNGIVGMAQLMLEDTTLCSQNHSKLTTIMKSGQHLAELANNVLEYAAMEGTDDKSLTITRVPIREFVNTIEELLQPLTIEKSLTFNIKCDKALPKYISTDAVKLKSILTNLISNSIKYTEQGSVTLTINLNDKNKIRFVIEDTGKGMSEKQFKEMLKPFNRGAMDVHKQSGAGLGLAIVQYILTTMNSELIWQSKQDLGTRLTFELDAAKDSVNGILEVDALATTKQVETNHSFELLLVEDMDLNIEVLKALLNYQHNLTIAKTGKAAIEWMSSKKFDAILLDIQLPDMSGIDVYQSKNETMQNIDTPVIALTASVTPKDIESYQQLGFIDIVEKPILKSKLYSALNKIATRAITALSSKSEDSLALGFSPEPLNLLLENLPYTSVYEIGSSLESELEQKIEVLIKLINEKDIDNYQKLSHTLASRYGQFGLIAVSQTLKSMSSNLQPNLVELTTLRSLMQDAFPALLEHLNNYRNEE